MDIPILGAALSFLGGVGIAALNAALTKAVLKKKPSALASFFTVRQILNIGYLAAVYFLAKVLPWDLFPLLIGAALGITLPSFFFTAQIAKLNDSLHKKADPGKGDEN